MIRSLATALAASTALAAPAFAGSANLAPADPVVPAPAPAPVYNTTDWTGAYGGLSLGYGDFDAGTADGDGEVYGLHGGYDHDFGTFVLGGELDYQSGDFDTTGGVDVDDITRLKLRAGYDAGDALLYGVVGAASANTNMGSDEGYVAGLGAEYRVTNQVSVGGEYLYHEFNDFNGGGTDVTANTFSARVNYRF
ncbi:outer membrane protein [Pseudooceanicola aestuarii]|uniref:outer membrane protein n=1 Tax=Pseudooceanicola aestuarii TaxID=2697319 RepID=UPI0013D2EAD4|nr:outer membrane beta-barrel protein [Pseudooceanicola aestuarii]